jgi:hypothetical protein
MTKTNSRKRGIFLYRFFFFLEYQWKLHCWN